MSRNNADARRYSYFELGLPVVHPEPQGLFKTEGLFTCTTIKSTKSYVWTTSKPVGSKQNAFLRVVFPQGKNCDKTDGRKFQ